MMKSLFLQWLLFLLGATALRPVKRGISFKEIPSAAALTPTTAQFTSTADSLDGPKISPVNTTSWDWWYFDVVSPDLNTSMTIVFFNALPAGFPFLPPSTDVLTVAISWSYANGTNKAVYIPASDALVTTVGQGSSGLFTGAGASWFGSPSLSTYTIIITNAANNIYGTFILKSRAPAHYPCGPAVAGQNMMVGPNIGWSSAMPDADGEVSFSLGGEEFEFSGVGYHDKNWSDQPFTANVASWYWGHARVGAYSIVWFDFLGLNGTEYVSSYIASSNAIDVSTCAAGSIVVRPLTGDYPPKVTSALPAGFSIEANLGGGGQLSVNVSIHSVVLGGASVYARMLGGVTGTVNGTAVSGGTALFEQFKMTL